MRNRIIVAIIRQLYREFLRTMIVKHVQETETDKDNLVIGLLDMLLEYNATFQKGERDG